MINKRVIIAFLLLAACQVIGTNSLFAQNDGKADKLFKEANYSAAQYEYALLLKRYPSFPLYLYRYARCAQELGDYPTAIEYFEKSGNRYDLKHFNLGEIYLHLGYPDQAIAAYESYLNTLKSDSDRIPYIHAQIRKAEKIQRYMRRVEKVQIIDSVQVPLNELLSAYRLSAETGNLTQDNLGQMVYTNQRNDRKLWASVDGERKWIVSSRNMMDTWTQPDTLPQIINMSAEQDYPYLLSDGVTLYFASKDTSGLGGYDIYVSRYNTYTETYTNPENLGYPYNSPANDYLMVVDEIHHIGYFATDRHAKEGYVHVYTFVPTEQKTYWRNISQDSLVAYAQLQQMLKVDEQPIVEQIQISDNEEDKTNENEIFFVLNDSVVYTSINHFQTAAARKAYQEWLNLQKQIEVNKQTLSHLRQQYALAEDEISKKELTPTILQIENNQSQLSKRCQNLLHEVRQAEIKAH